MIEESRKELEFCIAARVAEELGDAVAGMVRKAFCEGKLSQCSESMAVNSVFKDVISSEKYWKVQNSILLQNDILVKRPTCGSSYITLSKKQLEDLSESLFHPVLRNRLKAMEYLIRCVFADSSHVISFWDRLGTGLQINLSSPLSVISEASLQVYKKFLISSSPEVILQVYNSLLKVLSSILHKDFCILTLANTYLISDMIQLVNKFQRNVSKHWFRYPSCVITGIISNTFDFYEKCQWLTESGKNGLGHYLWLFDERALWLNSFLRGILSQQEVYRSISKNPKFVWALIETCQLYLEDDIPDQCISCVIQSIAILLRLMERNVGRKCLMELLTEKYEDSPSALRFYGTLDSVWTLLTTVCVNLFKANEITWLSDLLCKLMQNQIESNNNYDQQLILWLFNKMPSYNDPDYLNFVCDCVSKLSNESVSRKYILQEETGLKDLLVEMSKSADLEYSEVSPITVELLKINHVHILSNILLEPTGVLIFSKQDYQDMLSTLSEYARTASEECTNELLYFLTGLSEIELGVHVLSQNKDFIDTYFKNFSIETLLSERNLVVFCMHILNLRIPSVAYSEIMHYLMNKLEDKSVEYICQDLDPHEWTANLNHYYQIISHFSPKLLQKFWVEKRYVHFGEDNLSRLLPVPCLICQNCSRTFDLCCLNYFVCDVNNLIHISTQFDLQQLFVNEQTGHQQDSPPILDANTILRNHIIVRISVFGGRQERSLPTKNYSESVSVDIIQDLSRISEHVLTNKEDLQLELSENSIELNENELWVHFQELVFRKSFSVFHCAQFISYLVHNSQEQDYEESDVKDLTSKTDVVGIALTLQYGTHQKWLLVEDHETHKNHLSRLLNKFPPNKHFNILMATVFLICRGDLQTSLKFYTLLERSRNAVLPVTSLVQCAQDDKPNAYKGVLCSIFDFMVQKEMPSLFNVLTMAHLPPHKCLTLWIGQCFWNVLDMEQIALLLLLCVFQNGNFLLYACMALLKTLEPMVYNKFEQGKLLLFLREYSPKAFNVSDHLHFMQELGDKYFGLINNKMNIYLA